MLSNSKSSSEWLVTLLINGDVRLLFDVDGTELVTTTPPVPLDDEATEGGDGVEVREEWPFEAADGRPESTDEPDRLSALKLVK